MDNSHLIARIGDRVDVEDGPSELQDREAVVTELKDSTVVIQFDDDGSTAEVDPDGLCFLGR